MITTFKDKHPNLFNNIASIKRHWPVWHKFIDSLQSKAYQKLHKHEDYHVIHLSNNEIQQNLTYSLVWPSKSLRLLQFPDDLSHLFGMKLIASNDELPLVDQLNFSGSILDGGGYGSYTVNHLVQSGDPNNLLPWLFRVDTYEEFLKLRIPQDLYVLQNDSSGQSIFYDSMHNVYYLNEFYLKRVSSLEDFVHFSLHALFCGMNWYDAYPHLEFQQKFNLSYYSEIGIE